MKKKSEVYKYRGKDFRYDYEKGVVSIVLKATEQEYADNARWLAKYGKCMWEIEGGYYDVDSVGLSRANWKNKRMRNEYLDEWLAEREYEIEEMVANFVKYELPHMKGA